MDSEQLHPCARCARTQKTCCQRAEILVTSGDIRRIGDHSGRADFWSLREPEDTGYLEDDPDDPNWQRFTADCQGRRRMLNRRPNGDCTFLGPQGCVLPLETRPLVCRLYPFAFNERRLTGVDDGYCPTNLFVKTNERGKTMLTVLNMDPRDGERWRSALYHELREDWSQRCASE